MDVFYLPFWAILSIKHYSFLNCDDQALLWWGLSLEFLVQTKTYDNPNILKQMKVVLLELKLGWEGLEPLLIPSPTSVVKEHLLRL